jgi:2,3-bisphosphoglycerate-independent phosphoglycerate mutase
VYNNLTGKKVLRTASSAVNAVQSYYDNPEDPALIGDEFIPSTQIISEGKAIATIEDGDAVIFYNFRGDRPRELTRAFIEDGFSSFDRGNKLNLYYSIMTNYQKGLCPNVVLDKPSKMDGILGVVVNDAGIPQFRCAETEKFPHVTFFFNDYREEALSLEDRAIIPSPKEVATYDLKPEMSAKGVFDATKEAILSGKYGLIVVNFANPDMVGHTGCKEAILKAVEIVDKYVGDLLEAVKTMEGSAIVTADHGNCDQMYNVEIESLHTSHTLNPVEVVVVSEDFKNSKLLPSGKLENIAPTILQLMGIEKPAAMTGKSLIVESKDQ